MNENQAKKLFEKYNPSDGVVRCPYGRAKMRSPLDTYAKAAVNLYGAIRRNEFVEIFNAQNRDQTTADEIYIILLPNVLKNGWYGFYEDYIVHYAVLRDFDWMGYLERMQAEKPRYVPPKEQFLQFEWEEYEDNDHWQNVRKFMWDAFGYSKRTTEGFAEIKAYIAHSHGIKELGAIIEKHNLAFHGEKQAQEFFNLLSTAKNNTRIWENKGHTPSEMTKLLTSRHPKEPIIHQPKKAGRNQPCPCGSGKKYKTCCALIENSGAAQLSHSERKLFYETWYKLLDFVNRKLKVVDYKFSLAYPDYHDETLLHKIREKLWKDPKEIYEFINNVEGLSDEQIHLLQSWEKHRIKGQFVLVKYEPEYAVLMRADIGKTPMLYAVKGMTASIAQAMRRQLPIMLETVLLPFGDKIIYDSFMTSRTIEFGGGIREMFEAEYTKAKDQYGVITKLQ